MSTPIEIVHNLIERHEQYTARHADALASVLRDAERLAELEKAITIHHGHTYDGDTRTAVHGTAISVECDGLVYTLAKLADKLRETESRENCSPAPRAQVVDTGAKSAEAKNTI